ncbi:1 alpha subcomplex subunit 9, mitochondrial [Seminavis robusta]|uniref:1 alpha subcomplex subunit 9, mitochondrial n=1 Tax=Seminavis robusta TaxID=568900 RepID=A0A9N8DYS5_9STRA|nr:1 alpha subcomplex subunit 9, mitochondrial [Seminavis robusta]|eukprot:Sro459_g147370.1 1 alpha subcomplex subunit 9, mitochondrial (406) ;mRNA; r:55907-57393
MLATTSTIKAANSRLSLLQRTCRRALSNADDGGIYKPTLVNRRENESGIGGRGSDAGLKVAVFGASGFLGPYVCTELGSNGYMAYLANRGCELEMRHLKPMFELGRTRFVLYSPRDVESMKEVIADADVVINMIGKFYETWQPVQIDKFPYVGSQTNFTFEDANVTIPRQIAEICKELQVDHLIHLSSAAASPDSGSEWAKTKYEGELAIKEAFPWATIIRPTQLYGVEDRLFNWFPTMGQIYRCYPLINNGEALTQPVFVGDVAKTILRVASAAERYEGKTIDCFGPSDYSYRELAEFVNDITERNYPIVSVPKEVASRLADLLQYNRVGSDKPMITPDLVELWSENYLPRMTAEEYAAQPDDADKILTMADLGITATPVEKVAFSYLHRFRLGGHFGRVDGYR